MGRLEPVYSRIYLDSNIIISAFGSDADYDVTEHILEIIEAASGTASPPFIISELALAEVLVRPLRSNASEEILRMQGILSPSQWLAVVPVDRDILWSAAQLRAYHTHLRLPDAIHVATAIASRCSHLLTADQGLRAQYELPDGGLSRTSVIRPEPKTLADIATWLRA